MVGRDLSGARDPRKRSAADAGGTYARSRHQAGDTRTEVRNAWHPDPSSASDTVGGKATGEARRTAAAGCNQ
jgi:hypothetical protein